MVVFIVLTILLTGIDQASKFLIVRYLKPMGSVTVIPNLLTFSYVENNGAAFGLLENARWLFVGITIIAMAIIVGYYIIKKPKNKFLRMALILIAAGAMGNFVDRLLWGYVVDFIKISFFNFTCNIADIYLTFGVIALLIHIFFFDRKEGKNGKKIFDRS